MKKKYNTEIATFAAGCFWGVEDAFIKTPGVVETSAGYAGGHSKNPTYEQVCTGETGHAESVRVEYDPQRVTYNELLEVFWKIHDPTQVNQQGPDIGTQYRSVIFYHTPEQKQEAETSKEKFDESGKYDKPVATEIVPAGEFYEAEEYHQKYFQKTGKAVC